MEIIPKPRTHLLHIVFPQRGIVERVLGNGRHYSGLSLTFTRLEKFEAGLEKAMDGRKSMGLELRTLQNSKIDFNIYH